MQIARSHELPLNQLQGLLELNTSELGRMFGVSRQAAAHWLIKGVPSGRIVQVSTALAAAEVLAKKLKPGRLAAAARRPAAAYGGLSMIEMVRAGREDELLELIRASFDWASTV